MYGMSPHTLYYTLMDFGVNLEDEELQNKYGAYSGHDLADTIYKRYFESYKGVKTLISTQKEKARKNGYVKTLLGRKIYLPDINSNDRGKRGYSERLATNGKIQGSGNDIITSAQIKVNESHKLKMLGVEQLMQVHDELVIQVPSRNVDESIPIIKKLMEKPFLNEINLKVDLKVDYDVGENYYICK